MTPFDNAPEGMTALKQYAQTLPDTAPEALRTALNEAALALSPADAFWRAGEALYAHLDAVDAEGQYLCARLIAFAATYGWFGLGEGGRGEAIVKIALRACGKAPAWARTAPKNPPEALAQFATQPVQEVAAVEPETHQL